MMEPRGAATSGEKQLVPGSFPPPPQHLEKAGCPRAPSPLRAGPWAGLGGLGDPPPAQAAAAAGPGRAWGFAGVPEAGGAAPAPRGAAGADGNVDAAPGCRGPSCSGACGWGGAATPGWGCPEVTARGGGGGNRGPMGGPRACTHTEGPMKDPGTSPGSQVSESYQRSRRHLGSMGGPQGGLHLHQEVQVPMQVPMRDPDAWVGPLGGLSGDLKVLPRDQEVTSMSLSRRRPPCPGPAHPHPGPRRVVGVPWCPPIPPHLPPPWCCFPQWDVATPGGPSPAAFPEMRKDRAGPPHPHGGGPGGSQHPPRWTPGSEDPTPAMGARLPRHVGTVGWGKAFPTPRWTWVPGSSQVLPTPH